MTPSNRHSERGMTLMEVLVAMLIFTVVFMVALGLYQVANSAYMRTDAATIQQQNVRFAMDRMAETLRDAGANYNTLGASNVADEQIEGAWEAAAFVRGDFNNSRETPLESTTFPIVTTGNNEIVGYVLRKPGGDANNPIALTMKIDLTPSTGRDAILNGASITGEETATVQVAASTLAEETNPPYQLTRVTFNSAGQPQYEVVADDIFRLSFSYLNSAGAGAISTFGGADTERDQRAGIRQIDVNLIGMSSRPDPGYSDPNTYSPAEGTATKNLRKLSLTQHIVPPNLGVKGKRHTALPAVTVTAPASITVCTGHCRYFGLSWPASSSAGITTYKVQISAPASGPDAALAQTLTVTGLSYDYFQPTATARAYTFSVAATTGTIDSSYTSNVTATSGNDAASIPSAPANVGATQATGSNAMGVNWDAVTTNTGNITNNTCQTSGGSTSAPTSPWNNAAIDLWNYQVFRARAAGGVNGTFTAGAANRIDNQTISTLVNTTPTGASFTDNTAAPCSPYFYRVEAVDYCGVNSAASAAMASAATFDIQPTTVVPDVPGGTAGASAAVTGTTTSSAGNYNVTINWPPVIQTSAGVAAATAHYKVDRYRKIAPAATYTLETNFDVFEATTFSDVAPATVGGSATNYQYYVRALYDCASPRTSTQAGPYTATCTPAGTMTIGSPAIGTDISRPTVSQLTPTLIMTGAGWTSAQVTITGPNPSPAIVYSQTIVGPPAANTYTFPAFVMSNTATYPDGTYTISATAAAGSCTAPAQIRTFTASTVVCGLDLAAVPSYQGNGVNVFTGLTFKITNSCTTTPITFNTLKFTWSGVLPARFISAVAGPSGTLASGLTAVTGGSGVIITLSTPQTIAANTTSGTFTLTFSSNFTSDGTKSGTPGKFSSIIAHETSPAPANDELINGSPVP